MPLQVPHSLPTLYMYFERLYYSRTLPPKTTMVNKLPLLAALLLTFAVCTLSLPPCPVCRSTAVPYPPSTAASYKIGCSSGTLLFDSTNTTNPITSISAATQRLIVAPSSFLPNNCVAADPPSNGLKLNSSAPFNITSSNTIFYFNCPETTLNSPLNCTFNGLCHMYSDGTSSTSECGDNVPCCAGGSTTVYRIQVMQNGCRAYRSFVNLDYWLPVSQWPPPGVELQCISPPGPIRTSHGYRGLDSTCKRDMNSNNGVNRCFCESGLQWDLVTGVCANGGGKDRIALIAGLSVALGVAVLAFTPLLITFFLYKRRHRRLIEEQERHPCECVEIVIESDGAQPAATAATQVSDPPPRDVTISPPPHTETDGAQPPATAVTQVPDPPPRDVTISTTPDTVRDEAQPAATQVPDPLPRGFTLSPTPDIAGEGAQPAATAATQVPDPPPDIAGNGTQPVATAATRDIESQIAQPAAQVNSTFSGVLLTLCFTSALESLLLYLELRKERRFPISFQLFSLAITYAFATAFLQKIIHFRPNNKFASLLETVGKAFFAIAFFLAVIIPSPLWLRIVDTVILIFSLVIVFMYRQSSYANVQLGREPHLLLTTQQDAAAITNPRTQHQRPDPPPLPPHPQRCFPPDIDSGRSSTSHQGFARFLKMMWVK